LLININIGVSPLTFSSLLKARFEKRNFQSYSKANSSWSPTWAKFCQLIASYPLFYLNYKTQT